MAKFGLWAWDIMWSLQTATVLSLCPNMTAAMIRATAYNASHERLCVKTIGGSLKLPRTKTISRESPTESLEIHTWHTGRPNEITRVEGGSLKIALSPHRAGKNR
jgi:hypothetical protein